MTNDPDRPTTADDQNEALEKSGTVDTRIPERASTFPTSEKLVTGAPGAYIPPMGTGTLTGETDLGEGERVLELERKAQRAGTDIQRG